MARQQLLNNDGNPLYVQVANRLKDWIHDGRFTPGSKVPSVRELSNKLDVSISTILQSYSLLENQGFIEAKPQSGYYVKLRSVAPCPGTSKPMGAPRFVQSFDAFLDVIHACGDPELVPLGGAIVNSALLPSESLHRSLARVVKNNPTRAMQYDRSPGLWELRQQIASRSIEMGCEVDPEQVIITTGAMEGINLSLLAFAKPGDTVAVESPTYYGILQTLEALGLKVLELPTNAEAGIDLDQFEDKLKKFSVKALIVTPSFQNPLGSLMTDESKQRLQQICLKHNVMIIEDDVYGELNFSGQRPTALLSYDKKGNTVFVSSFSKTLASGYRIGWIVAPKKLVNTFERLRFLSTISANSIGQLAIADHLEHNNFDRHLRKLRQTLGQNVLKISNLITAEFPQGTLVTQPKGGCLLWVEFPKEVNSLELHQKALQEGISIIPGPLFSASGKYLNNIRINCANPWSPEIEKSILKIGELAKKSERS